MPAPLFPLLPLPQALQQGLVVCPLESIRRRTAEGVQAMLRDSPPAAAESVVAALLAQLPGLEAYAPRCAQYFELLVRLIESPAVGPTAIGDLVDRLVHQLRVHPGLEVAGAERRVDQVLVGLLKALRALCRRAPEYKPVVGTDLGVVLLVLEHCLLELPTPDAAPPALPPKAKSRVARDACYDLLVELASNCEVCAPPPMSAAPKRRVHIHHIPPPPPPGRRFTFHSGKGGGGLPPSPLRSNSPENQGSGNVFWFGPMFSSRAFGAPMAGFFGHSTVSFLPPVADTMSQRPISAFFGTPVQPCPRAKRDDIVNAALYFRFQDRWTGKKRQEAYNMAQKACSTLFLNTP